MADSSMSATRERQRSVWLSRSFGAACSSGQAQTCPALK
jgi:hypothetical protein